MIGERNDDEQLEIQGPAGFMLRARGQGVRGQN